MVVLEKVSCLSGKHSIADVSLDVREGDYFTILGPTGAGKTVLLECIAGLRQVNKGKIFAQGKDITNVLPEDRRFGYVPQDFVLFPFLTVRDNILFGCSGDRKENTKRLEDFIRLFRIESILDRMPVNLSGGEKQRVCIVRALVRNPKILLFDEPYSSIDEGLRKKLWLDMRKIHSAMGNTVIHITHDLEEAFTLSSRIAVIIDGRIVQQGTREDIFYNPENKKVAAFLGLRNILCGVVRSVDMGADRMVLSCGSYDIATPFMEGIAEGANAEFCVLPQEIKIIKEEREIRESLKDNVFEGKIVNVIPHGVSYTLYFKITGEKQGNEEFDFEINIPATNFLKLNLNNDAEVKVSLRKNAIKVFRPL